MTKQLTQDLLAPRRLPTGRSQNIILLLSAILISSSINNCNGLSNGELRVLYIDICSVGDKKDVGDEITDRRSSSVVGSGVVEVIEFTEVTEFKDSKDVADEDCLETC